MRRIAVVVLALGSLVSAPVYAQSAAEDPFGGLESAPAQPAPKTPDAKRPLPEAPLCYWAEADAEANQQIRQVLRQPLSSLGIDFQEAALEEVVEFLKDEYDIEILLDVRALDEFGIQLDEPISVNLRNLTFEAALATMLRPLELDYLVRNGAVVITTDEVADRSLSTAIYPVSDFVESRVSERGEPACPSLMETILATVAPETWKDGGGAARMHFMPPSSLVITQTDEGHRQVQYFLKALRQSHKDAQPGAAVR